MALLNLKIDFLKRTARIALVAAAGIFLGLTMGFPSSAGSSIGDTAIQASSLELTQEIDLQK